MPSGVYKRTNGPWNKGLTKNTDYRLAEAGEKISVANKGQIPWNKILTYCRQCPRIIGKPRKGHSSTGLCRSCCGKEVWSRSGMREMYISSHANQLGIPLSEQQKSQRRESSTKAWSDTELRQRQSCMVSKFWENPEHAKKVLRRRSPNYPEQGFINLCTKYDLPYRYVGNGQLVIGRKNPDFVDSTGTKLIEIWGEHWHHGQNPQDRIDFFRSRGYDCLVIMAKELNDGIGLLAKVMQFHKSSSEVLIG